MDRKLPGLQIARACAALGIAYFHSWHVTMPFPPDTAHPIALLAEHGWIAVDFFFAISGFVICMATASPRFDPVNFMTRRAFRLYPLWIATSFVYLWLTDYLGRSPRQTDAFFNWSLTLLPTDGFPFYDLGWSLQHELAFYLLACLMVPMLGLRGLVVLLALGVAADHLVALPWVLHQYFSYYGNFLAGIAAFLVCRKTARFGALPPIALGFVALYLAPSRDFYPVGLFCWLIGFVNLRPQPGRPFHDIGTLLGDASYSIYLLHPLAFSWVYIQLQPPLPALWMQEPLRWGTMTAVCAGAITSWMLFERPMNWIGKQIGRLAIRRDAVSAVGNVAGSVAQTNVRDRGG